MVKPHEASEHARQRLRELADQQEAQGPSPLVERRVMAAWDTRAAQDARQPARATPGRTPQFTMFRTRWALASTLVLMIGGGAALGLRWSQGRGPSEDRARHYPKGAAGVPSTREVAMRSASAFLDDDPSSLQVVRVWADASALRTMGVPLSGADSESPIALEVVLRADGTAASARVLGNLEGR